MGYFEKEKKTLKRQGEKKNITSGVNHLGQK